MRIRVLLMAAAVIALCLVGIGANAVQLAYDNFDADATATGTPPGWGAVWNTGTDGAVVELVPGSGDHQARVHDLNGNNNNQCILTKTFAAVSATTGNGTGIVVAQGDLGFSVNTAAFLVVLSNNGTTGNKVAARMQFEGKIAWETGGGPGRISWYKSSAQPSVLLEDGVGGPSYVGGVDGSGAPTTWYTFKIVANCGVAPQTVGGVTVNSKCFHFYFGPKGGALQDIDQYAPNAPYPDEGAPFYDASGVQVDQITTLQFASSAKKIEDESNVYIDNISVTGDATVANCANTAAAKSTPLGTIVQLTDKIVTAGTDQLGAFFYIQDSLGGMRVRPYPFVAVHQGDKVSVSGTLQRASEGGSYVKRVGEKEIDGLTQVDVTPGPFPLPKAVAMSNKTVGGGDFGPIESDGFVAQPGVYGGDGDMGIPVTTRLQTPAAGLCNIGRLVRVCGRVLYSDPQNSGTGSFFYIDDGSGVKDGSHFPTWLPDDGTNTQIGIRINCRNAADPRLLNIQGKYAVVTGIVGAIGASESVIHTGNSSWAYCNVPVIRPIEEIYTDSNLNGVYDQGEPFVDSNGNGVWDGMMFLP